MTNGADLNFLNIFYGTGSVDTSRDLMVFFVRIDFIMFILYLSFFVYILVFYLHVLYTLCIRVLCERV